MLRLQYRLFVKQKTKLKKGSALTKLEILSLTSTLVTCEQLEAEREAANEMVSLVIKKEKKKQ